VEYGATGAGYQQHTDQVPLAAGQPTLLQLTGLLPDREYQYQLRLRQRGEADFRTAVAATFHTQRAPGSPFTFALQGDSHPERPQQHDAALYAQTLRAVAADRPDFYLTSGDDFSVDTLATVDPAEVRGLYLRQRHFLSLVGQSAPLFLVNGNHEQAAQANLDGTPNNVAVWAQNARNALFPLPAPDAFYTGDAAAVEQIGVLRDYYAWTWGDALFVVIDPYWHSAQPVDNVYGGGDKRRDLWGITLGDAQYRWLQQTLTASRAKYKFVFAHHVLGTGRGGVEQASLYEWGGHDRNGADLFAARRPGWPLPIHQLLVQSGVTIFFQGHDHVFVHQELDGVVYQTLPQPADANYTLYNADAYRSGDKLPNSGYLRVGVAPGQVTVEYVRQYLPAHLNAARVNGAVAFRYTVPPRQP
jgi:hypothetical protein